MQRTAAGGHLGLFMGSEALREHWPPLMENVAARSGAAPTGARVKRRRPAIPAP
jgi:hypothetical protein